MKLLPLFFTVLLVSAACGPTDTGGPGGDDRGPDAASPDDPDDPPDGPPGGCGDDVCATDAGVPADPDPDAEPDPVTVDVELSLFGDCVTAACPPEAPHPVGCEVFFSPGDDRGCVASTPLDPVVYFQAGDQCNAGFISGTLSCSSTPGPALTQASCPINKPIQFHPADPSGCPEVTD